MLKTITIFMMFVKIIMASIVGSCNRCFPGNDVACVDETHFTTCFKGWPTATITKCPGNRICTDDSLICRSSADGYTPVCYHKDYCGECSITNFTFTCLDAITYGYCFGGKTPHESTFRPCPQGFVCNYNSQEVCVPEDINEPSCPDKTLITTEINTIPNESTIVDTTLITTTDQITATSDMATDSSTEVLTTTTKDLTTIDQTTATREMTTGSTTELSTIASTKTITTTLEITTISRTKTTTEVTTTSSPKTKPRDAKTICEDIGKIGYFKSDDVTCQQYVYCYLLSGQYLGWFYYCNTYFNDATKSCQKERPENCVAYQEQLAGF